jgi:DNA gyrase subunit A
MEVGLVQQIDLNEEMQQAYLDYAMSVIVARALPDARDGLKPVHRRILYAMHDMGLRPDTPYKKSARIVGEVLGKYHPHGDMSVYEAMARMAQDFSMRYMLVDGQGNFGSVDGDPPAAMRYTEARLADPAVRILADIEKNTVDFTSNFDETLDEPTVLPASIPNLLVNGATGIAVGMATSIPPHNLGEVVDAIQFMLKNWDKLDDISVEDVMNYIQGPDFPTGGIIIQGPDGEALVGAYSTGRGRVTVRARVLLEQMERGRNRIIVTELPYMTNKSSLIERIADMARDEKLEGIVDLRDESDRHGMRIVIELSKNADPEAVLRDLYKYTPMQNTFSLIMLALVNGEPRLLSLKQALRVYIEHRLEIVKRRTEFDLDKARRRAHILEGLRVALKNLDEVINLIRRARDVDTARRGLMRRFKLSEVQAQATLDMPLRRLAALERKKIEIEYKELQELIKKLTALLRSPKKMRQVVGDELLVIKETFGDRRRTHIARLEEGQPKVSLLTASQLMPEKDIWLVVSSDGLISRTLEDKQPRPSGREAPTHLVRANTRDTLYLVNDQGEAAALPVHTLPETDKPSEGAALSKVSTLNKDDHLAALFTLPPQPGRDEDASYLDDWYVLTVTAQGMVKKSAISELPGASANTFTLVKVNQGDRLGWLNISNGENDVLLVTAQGMAIRFKEIDVRPMGLVAAGVMGIKLQAKDEVIGAELLPASGDVFMATAEGKGKRVRVSQFPTQGRYGQGVVAWKLTSRDRIVGLTVGRGTQRVTLHLKQLAPKSARLDEAPLQGRAAGGKSIQQLKSSDKIVRLTVPWEPPRPAPKKKTTRRTKRTSTRRTSRTRRAKPKS